MTPRSDRVGAARPRVVLGLVKAAPKQRNGRHAGGRPGSLAS
jgi:hypothetical protein